MSFSGLYQTYIVPASTFLPIVAGLIYYKKLSKAMHALVIYLCIALLINIGGIILASHNTNNLPLLHLYTLFELVAVMWYYKLAFANKQFDKWINVIMIIYPVFCIINFCFLQSIYQFNTYTRPLEAIIIIVFSSLYLALQTDHNPSENVSAGGRWVASGFLLYFCSSLFQFIFSNVVSHKATRQQKMIIWDIHDTFVLIMYLFFFVAIRHDRSKR